MTNTLLGDSVIVNPTEPAGNNRRKVWMQKGKNKFNPNDKTNGYLNIDGSFTSVTDWTCSGFIEINSNKYILSANTTARRVIWCEYDGSMNIIGTRHEVAYGNPIAIVSVNTKYIRVCFNDGTATDIQLEQGTTATTYEPYVEDKIYIKNNNDVYEEFIKKQEEIYSIEEQRIGTWIDGKTIYRKTIIDTTFRTDFYPIANNIKQFVNQYGYVQRKDYPNSGQFINSRAGTNMSIQFLASNIDSGIQIDWGSNWKENYSTLFDKIIITVEYTKTTD